MPIEQPYKYNLDLCSKDFERKGGAEMARQSISTLLQGILIDSLIGRSLDRWSEVYLQHRKTPTEDQSSIVLPSYYMNHAVVSWFLNQPTETIVQTGWDAVEAAWSNADNDYSRTVVSSAALGLAHGRGNQEEIAHWCKIRQNYAPWNSMADVELLLGSAALPMQDIMATIAQWNISLFGESVANAIAALHLQAQTIGQSLASLLSEGCRRIDEDYWPGGVCGSPRANFEDLGWTLTKDSLNAYLFISGTGGYLHNPAPLFEPLLQIAGIFENMLIGMMPNFVCEKVPGAILRQALADPNVPIEITIFISDSIHNDLDISDADLAPYQQRLAKSVQWMQQRHPHFSGEVKLSLV